MKILFAFFAAHAGRTSARFDAIGLATHAAVPALPKPFPPIFLVLRIVPETDAEVFLKTLTIRVTDSDNKPVGEIGINLGIDRGATSLRTVIWDWAAPMPPLEIRDFGVHTFRVYDDQEFLAETTLEIVREHPPSST